MRLKEDTCKDIAHAVLERIFRDSKNYQDIMHSVWETVAIDLLVSNLLYGFVADHGNSYFLEKLLLKCEPALKECLLSHYEDFRKSHQDVIIDWYEEKRWISEQIALQNQRCSLSVNG